jgi:hypothetical protein
MDSLAYMIYNGKEQNLPNDESPLDMPKGLKSIVPVRLDNPRSLHSIATDPKNGNWMQGPPVVFVNNQAPLYARALDAVACAVRTVCDQANESATDPMTTKNVLAPGTKINPPGTMVASAQALLQQHEANQQTKHSNERTAGLRLMISALDAVATAAHKDCTDDAIQGLLSVCNTAIENPLVLHHAGPTYHAVSNAAMRLGHWLNQMDASFQAASSASTNDTGGSALGNSPSAMNVRLWEEVLDTYMAIRKLLTVHRRRLARPLRCHEIPRPNLRAHGLVLGHGGSPKLQQRPLIDMSEIQLCHSRFCLRAAMVELKSEDEKSPGTTTAEDDAVEADDASIAAADTAVAARLETTLELGNSCWQFGESVLMNASTSDWIGRDDDELLTAIQSRITE